jgi:hypothetical protein
VGALGPLLELCKLGLVKLKKVLQPGVYGDYDGVLQGAIGAVRRLLEEPVLRPQVLYTILYTILYSYTMAAGALSRIGDGFIDAGGGVPASSHGAVLGRGG